MFAFHDAISLVLTTRIDLNTAPPVTPPPCYFHYSTIQIYSLQVELTFGSQTLGPNTIGAPKYIGQGAYSVSYVATKVCKCLLHLKPYSSFDMFFVLFGNKPMEGIDLLGCGTNRTPPTSSLVIWIAPPWCEGYFAADGFYGGPTLLKEDD